MPHHIVVGQEQRDGGCGRECSTHEKGPRRTGGRRIKLSFLASVQASPPSKIILCRRVGAIVSRIVPGIGRVTTGLSLVQTTIGSGSALPPAQAPPQLHLPRNPKMIRSAQRWVG